MASLFGYMKLSEVLQCVLTQALNRSLSILRVALAFSLCCVPSLIFGQASSNAISGADAPPELTGPSKSISPLAPVFREFAASIEVDKWKVSDAAAMRDASDRLTEFLSKHPDFGFGYGMRAMTGFCSAGSTDYQSISSDLKNALKYYSPLNDGAFDEASLVSMRAKVHFQVGEYKEALDDLEAAMKANLNNAADLFGSGETEPETANNNPCIWTMGNFDLLTKRFPRDYRVPMLRGIYLGRFALFNQKYNEAAIQELQKAAIIDPRSAYPSFFIGRHQSRPEKAIRFYTKAILIDPTFVLAYAKRASSYMELKDYQNATADYDNVIKLDTTNVTAREDRGWINLQIGRYLAATVDLSQAIQLKGKDNCKLLSSYEYLGDAYTKLGAYQDAIGSYSQGIKCLLAGLTHTISLRQIKKLYPEYDAVPDDVLISKINLLFWPQYDHTTMAKILTEQRPTQHLSAIANLYEKRADCYLKNGDYRRGLLEFNRILKGIPDIGQYIERWRPMGGKEGEEWFIDVQSMELKETLRVWAKFKEKDKGHTVQAFDFDCKTRRIAATSTAKYNSQGEFLESSTTGSGWQQVIPETRGEQLYFGMCGK